VPLSRARLVPVLLASIVGLAATLVGSIAHADTAACIAATEQGLALRQQGKLRDALKQLAMCADVSCPAEVALECSHRIDEVKAALPTLILEAKDGAGNDRASVAVSMDGAHLTDTLDGRPILLDPGEHMFTFVAPGEAPVERNLVLREGEKDRRESVVIGAPAPLPVPAPVTTASWWTGRRTLAVVTAGVGVVGLGFGAGWGAYAVSSQNREKSDCSKASCPNPPQATEDYNTARKDATASTVGFVAGAVLLTAGAVLWLTAPSAHDTPAAASLGVTPIVTGPGAGGLLLVGGF
jgi:hypothetical protein